MNTDIHRSTIILVLCMMVTTLVTGCGSGSSDSDNPNPTPAMSITINGEGYFVLRKPQDESTYYFTKLSSFLISQEHYIVNPQGYALVGKQMDTLTGAPYGTDRVIVLPDQSPLENISSYGTITVTTQTGTVQPVFSIGLAFFSNPGGLKELSEGIYIATEQSGPAMEAGMGSGYVGTMEYQALSN
jgi:flagellar hook protein FlgE